MLTTHLLRMELKSFLLNLMSFVSHFFFNLTKKNNLFAKKTLITNFKKIKILDSPVIHLTLGRNVNSEDIEETDDVYFECKINANPSAYKVIWKHNVSGFRNESKFLDKSLLFSIKLH